MKRKSCGAFTRSENDEISTKMTKFNPGRDLDLDPTTSRHMPGSYSIQGASTLRVSRNSDNGKVLKNHAQTDGQTDNPRYISARSQINFFY